MVTNAQGHGFAGGWSGGIGVSQSAAMPGVTPWIVIPNLQFIYEQGSGNDSFGVVRV